MRKLLILVPISFLPTLALGAQIYVAPGPPEGVTATFMSRLQVGALKDAVAHAGHLIVVPNATYVLRVPCDGMPGDKFAKITITLKEKSILGLKFENCGISFIDVPLTLSPEGTRL